MDFLDPGLLGEVFGALGYRIHYSVLSVGKSPSCLLTVSIVVEVEFVVTGIVKSRCWKIVIATCRRHESLVLSFKTTDSFSGSTSRVF